MKQLPKLEVLEVLFVGACLSGLNYIMRGILLIFVLIFNLNKIEHFPVVFWNR